MNELDKLIDELITDGKLGLDSDGLEISGALKFCLDKADDGTWEVRPGRQYVGSPLSQLVSSKLTMLHASLTSEDKEAQASKLATEIRNNLGDTEND